MPSLRIAMPVGEAAERRLNYMVELRALLFFAAQSFLARRRLWVPEDVSLVCTDHSPDFERCHPAISHIRWDSRPLILHILKWVANVSQGKRDLRQTSTPAVFVPAGAIGPAPRGR